MAATPAVEITRVVRAYQALRPLRLASLSVAVGERVAVSGIDVGGAEVLVNLITGAALPDEGEVRIFGQSTAKLSSGDEWLAFLERFGIVSPRAVLMEGATVQQNLAMPFTLQIEPVAPDVAARVEALAAECGLANEGGRTNWLAAQAGATPPEIRARLHFARALALEPVLVLLEHPTVGVDGPACGALGEDVARALDRRGLTAIAITQDVEFAARVAHRTLRLQPASGELRPQRRGWFR